MANFSAAALQIEFPLRVAVCAWCRPEKCGSVAGELSHGICLRHLRKLKLELRGIAAKRPRRSTARQHNPEALLLLES